MKKEITNVIVGLIVLLAIVMVALSIVSTFIGIVVGLFAIVATISTLAIMDRLTHGKLSSMPISKSFLTITIVGSIWLVVGSVCSFFIFAEDSPNPAIVAIYSFAIFFFVILDAYSE